MSRRLGIACVLLLLLGLFAHLHANINVPLARPLQDFPLRVGEWRQVENVTFSDEILGVLRATDYLFRDYVDNAGNRMNLYIGFHDGGPGSGPIHSPKNCLPGAGWAMDTQQTVTLPGPDGQPVQVMRAEYSKDGRTKIFYYWFNVRDHVVINEYKLKLMEITSSLTMRRKDSSFIRMAMDKDAVRGDGAAVFQRFFHEFYPRIREFLPS